MNVVWIPIRSDPDPASPLPWAEMEVDVVGRQVRIRRANGRPALLDVTDQVVPIVPSLTAPTETHYLYMDEDGTVAFEAQSEAPKDEDGTVSFYAELGQYDPLSDTLTILHFRDMNEWTEAEVAWEQKIQRTEAKRAKAVEQ